MGSESELPRKMARRAQGSEAESWPQPSCALWLPGVSSLSRGEEHHDDEDILAALLLVPFGLATPRGHAEAQAPDYGAIVAAPDRSVADRKLDTNRAPAQWLGFIGAKPGMKILDIFAVYLEGRAPGARGRAFGQGLRTELAARL